jgi:hypothetical protein
MPIAYFSHRSGRIMDWCSVTPTGNPERGYWDFSSDTYISTKEKVNSIDETSTNSTIPSTKAVYDFVSQIQSISISKIDEICGSSIESASEVIF